MNNLPTSYTIESIAIASNYELVARLMQQLHENERSLNDKTALWQDIEPSYMRHLIETQHECNGTFLIVKHHEEVAGFIFGYAEEQDDSRFEIYEGTELYISEGYIYPQHRRKGLYMALNNQLEQIYIAQGVKRITRFTLANNLAMQHLLEEAGYKVTRLLYEKWL